MARYFLVVTSPTPAAIKAFVNGRRFSRREQGHEDELTLVWTWSSTNDRVVTFVTSSCFAGYVVQALNKRLMEEMQQQEGVVISDYMVQKVIG